MTTAIRRRRGTTAQHSTFIGLEGETTIDTDKEVVVVHDGTTQGGFPLMRENGSNSALALGSAGTPSLKFTGDTNTGIYSPGADQVAISTGGSGRLFVDASGNVGVGTSPSQLFHVAGASPVALLAASSGVGTLRLTRSTTTADLSVSTSLASLATTSATDLAFSTNNTERLRITSAGLVGVGTSSPNLALHVSSGTAAGINNVAILKGGGSSSGNGAGLVLSPDSANTYNTWLGSRVATAFGGASWGCDLVLSTNNNSAADNLTERMRITSAGNVGIGTSVPSKLLTIGNSSTANTTVRLNCSQTAGSDTGMYSFGIDDSSDFAGMRLDFTDRTSKGLQIFTAPGFGYPISFYGSSGNQDVTIDTSGRVGIGTTTPDKLITAEGATAPGIKVKTTSSASYSTNEAVNDAGDYIQLFANGSARAAFGPLDTGETGLVSTKSLSIMAANSNQVIKFATGGSTERARIDSSGRLLVGTSSAFDTANTGTAWLMGIEKPSGYSALSIKTNEGTPNGAYLNLGKSRGTSANSKTIVSNNDELGGIYFEGADGSAMRLGASVAAFVDGTPGTNDMPGRLVFSTTADGASSPTERMRIASNGNVYIGGGTSFGSGGWTTQNSGEQVNQYSQTSDVRTLYNWSTNNNGTNTSVVYVQSDGKIYARTTTLQAISSERRLKENIVPLNADDAWETVKSVPFYSYNFIGADPSNVLYGPMADEVPDEMRVPTSQSDDVGVIHTYDNGMLQARLYVALQAALNKIETLEAKVAALESA